VAKRGAATGYERGECPRPGGALEMDYRFKPDNAVNFRPLQPYYPFALFVFFCGHFSRSFFAYFVYFAVSIPPSFFAFLRALLRPSSSSHHPALFSL